MTATIISSLHSSRLPPILCFPSSHFLHCPLHNILCRRGLTKCFHKFPAGIHQVKVYTMIHQVISIWTGVFWRTEVHSICFTHCFGFVVRSDQAYKTRVEVSEVAGHLWGRISSRIDRNEDGLRDWTILFVYKVNVSGPKCPSNRNSNEDPPSSSTTLLILSSSSGQISGQFVNPKYTKLHFPSKFCSVNFSFLCVLSVKGPPIAAFPHLRDSSSFPMRTKRDENWCSSQDKKAKEKKRKWGIRISHVFSLATSPFHSGNSSITLRRQEQRQQQLWAWKPRKRTESLHV